jgi:hypothetical protein
LSPEGCQQIDTPSLPHITLPSSEAYKEHIVMLDEDVLSTRNHTHIFYLPAWRFAFGNVCPVSVYYIIIISIRPKHSIPVTLLSLPSLLINSVATHPHLRRNYAVALAGLELSYAQLASNPEEYVCTMSIIAGAIIEVVDMPEGTRLVLLQYPTRPSAAGVPKPICPPVEASWYSLQNIWEWPSIAWDALL